MEQDEVTQLRNALQEKENQILQLTNQLREKDQQITKRDEILSNFFLKSKKGEKYKNCFEKTAQLEKENEKLKETISNLNEKFTLLENRIDEKINDLQNKENVRTPNLANAIRTKAPPPVAPRGSPSTERRIPPPEHPQKRQPLPQQPLPQHPLPRGRRTTLERAKSLNLPSSFCPTAPPPASQPSRLGVARAGHSPSPLARTPESQSSPARPQEPPNSGRSTPPDSFERMGERVMFLETTIKQILAQLRNIENGSTEGSGKGVSVAFPVGEGTPPNAKLSVSSKTDDEDSSSEWPTLRKSKMGRKKLKTKVRKKKDKVKIFTNSVGKGNKGVFPNKKRDSLGRGGKGGSSEEKLEELLVADSPLSLTDQNQAILRIPIHQLIEEERKLNEIQVKLVASPEDVNLQDENGNTPLHLISTAVSNPRMDIAAYLICVGADINIVNKAGATSLMLACKQVEGGNGKLVQLLVKNGAQVTFSDEEGNTTMHYFVRQQPKSYHIELFKKTLNCMMSQFPDPELKNKEGCTILHSCGEYGCLEVYQLLLAHCDPNARDLKGETVFHKAVRGKNNALLNFLLDGGFDPRDPEGTGSSVTPLDIARGLGPSGKTTYDLIRGKISNLDMQTMKKKEKKKYKRALTVEEILVTEDEYLADLRVLIALFLIPLRQNVFGTSEEKILSKEEFRNIFFDVEEIYEVGNNLYKDLKAAFEATDDASDVNIGGIFINHMEALEKYSKVCTHQQSCTEFLQEALGNSGKKKREKEATPFATFCSEVEASAECRHLDLSNFLIKPFQRITKYPLLFRELIKFTDTSHPDHASLLETLDSLNVIINSANEKKRETDEMYKLLEIQANLVYEKPEETLKLGQNPGRRFIQEGDFQVSVAKKAVSSHHLFLLSDLLIVALPPKPKQKKFTFVCYFSLPSCVIEALEDDKGALTKILARPSKFGFQLINPKENTRVVVFTKTEAQMQEWFDLISAATTGEEEWDSGSVISGATISLEPEWAEVIYSFTGDFENALPLKSGQMIAVLEKDKDGDGWWLGEVDGKTGYFPAGYVELK